MVQVRRLRHRPGRLEAALTVVALASAAALLVSLRPSPAADVDHTSPGAPVARTPTTLAVRDGFEADSIASGEWRQVRAAADSGGASVSTRAAHTGSRSLVVSATAAEVKVVRTGIAIAPGTVYAAGAYARVAAGTARLDLVFHASDGRQLANGSVAAGGPSRVWSRASVSATAPPSATTADLVLLAPRGTRVSWDDVELVSVGVPNGGFEAAGLREPATPDGWLTTTPPGSVVKRASTGTHSGTGALEVRTGGGARTGARSTLVPVIPGSEMSLGAWVRPRSGRQDVVVEWYDGRGRPLDAAIRSPVTANVGAWSAWQRTLAVPDSAGFATVEVAAGDGASHWAWDDVTLAPAPAHHLPAWQSRPVGDLSGYVNTTTSGVITVGGRSKLYTVVSGDPAQFQLADLDTGRLEARVPLAHLTNGWAMTNGADGHSVYLGGGDGHLLRYDTGTHRIHDLGRATPRALVVFALVTGPDGRLWGGSYPGGELWSYDPSTARFTTLAPLGSGQEYARSLAIDGEHLYVGTGAVGPAIVELSLADPRKRRTIALPSAAPTGFVMELQLHGRLLAAKLPGGRRGLYDVVRRSWDVPAARDAAGNQLTQTPTAASARAPFYYFSNGRLWRVDPRRPDATAKQAVALSSIPPGRNRIVVRARIGGVFADWLLSHDGQRGVIAIDVSRLPGSPGPALPRATWQRLTIDFKPTALRIKSLGVGAGGDLYVGGFGGSSLSTFDAEAPYPALRPRVGGVGSPSPFGEVEGMVTNGPYEFFGSYTSARIYRFDTRLPWVDGDNPRLLTTLGPAWDQDRPGAWATAGTTTYFGTVPKYGVLGGVLGWFDGAATAPSVVRSPVPDQSVVALAASGPVVYGGTSRWGGLGVTPTARSAAVFAYDTRTRRTLWSVTPSPGSQSFGAVLLTHDGHLWVATTSALHELDRRTGRTVRTVRLGLPADLPAPTFSVTDLADGDGVLYLAAAGGVWGIDPATGSVTTVAAQDVYPSRVEFVADSLYYPSRMTLMRADAR